MAEAAQPTCPMVLPVGGFGLILHLLLCKKISQDPNDFSELKRGQLDWLNQSSMLSSELIVLTMNSD